MEHAGHSCHVASKYCLFGYWCGHAQSEKSINRCEWNGIHKSLLCLECSVGLLSAVQFIHKFSRYSVIKIQSIITVSNIDNGYSILSVIDRVIKLKNNTENGGFDGSFHRLDRRNEFDAWREARVDEFWEWRGISWIRAWRLSYWAKKGGWGKKPCLCLMWRTNLQTKSNLL